MSKYKLIVDEKGKFAKESDKYIIIGGLLFDEKDEEYLEKILRPAHKNLCEAFNMSELHGKENKKIFDYLCCLLGAIEELKVVLFIIDKEEAFIFDRYTDNSFKYNKALEHIIHKLIYYKLIKADDELIIKLDTINLSEIAKENLTNYLPNNFKCVKSVTEVESKDIICAQFADVIVNKFTLKKHHKLDSKEIKLLSPKIYFFFNKTEQDYLIE